MTMICRDKTNRFIQADEVLHLTVSHQGNLVVSKVSPLSYPIQQQCFPDAMMATGRYYGQRIEIIFPRTGFHLRIGIHLRHVRPELTKSLVAHLPIDLSWIGKQGSDLGTIQFRDTCVSETIEKIFPPFTFDEPLIYVRIIRNVRFEIKEMHPGHDAFGQERCIFRAGVPYFETGLHLSSGFQDSAPVQRAKNCAAAAMSAGPNPQ